MLCAVCLCPIEGELDAAQELIIRVTVAWADGVADRGGDEYVRAAGETDRFGHGGDDVRCKLVGGIGLQSWDDHDETIAVEPREDGIRRAERL